MPVTCVLRCGYHSRFAEHLEDAPQTFVQVPCIMCVYGQNLLTAVKCSFPRHPVNPVPRSYQPVYLHFRCPAAPSPRPPRPRPLAPTTHLGVPVDAKAVGVGAARVVAPSGVGALPAVCAGAGGGCAIAALPLQVRPVAVTRVCKSGEVNSGHGVR